MFTKIFKLYIYIHIHTHTHTHTHLEKAEDAKSLQSCPTLCDPIDGSPPGFRVPGILQARTLEWVAISFSNAWKWKVKPLSRVRLYRPHGLQPTRLLHPLDFPGKSTGVGCHCLLQRQRNQRSYCQHLLDHRKSKRVPEKHLLLLYWLHQTFDCVDHNKLENS